jgi:hypothetical protein
VRAAQGTSPWLRSVRVTADWEDNVMPSAFEHGSLPWMRSFPLLMLLFGTLAGYFYVQYFIGYGESL